MSIFSRLGSGLILSTTVVLAVAGCEKKSEPQNNFVEANGTSVSRTLTSDGVSFKVVSANLLNAAAGGTGRSTVANGLTATAGDAPKDGTALTLGFPRELIGQQNMFGGVVTAVSEHENQELGGLKLSDLSPLHVTTILSTDGTALILNGCKENCEEGAPQEDLFRIPVVSQDAGFVYLDLTAFGSGLDFIKAAIPDAGVSAVDTKVARFDFSLSTLVFDVDNTYDLGLPQKTVLTTRWYLKLGSGFHSDFTPRAARADAGFFMTARAKNAFITRFSKTTNADSLTKYYIKNVPAQYHAAFADSFEDWNKNLSDILGRKMFEYEFIDQGDARANQIVAGDVRYNVIEWDLVNLASYGGLGPSIANQMTGETFSANVLIQGPTVMVLYKKWWRVAEAAKALEAAGQPLAAQKLRADFVASTKQVARNVKAAAYGVSLGQNLAFKVRSADPRLFDAQLDANDFFDRPDGYTFDTYMYGYFRDMVAHELGHNIGLRHNFRGSLGNTGTGEIASVSRSVMEYLNRNYRHLDRVGPYDRMAIAYGYRGIEPDHKDWFCTDENVVSATNFTNSAECSPNDATNDPFGFFIGRFERAKDFLILPGSEQAPVWTVDVLGDQVTAVVKELANYYVSSLTNAALWTNFAPHGAMLPAPEVPAYILGELSAQFCDQSLEKAIAQKTPEAQVVARKNLADLIALVKTTTAAYAKPVRAFTDANFACFK